MRKVANLELRPCSQHQWLRQFGAEDDNMLAAVRNATNLKVVFRIKDPVEAEELAHAVVPLDLEMPVSALVKPTVVGHRRIRLENENSSEQIAATKAVTDSEGTSESYSVSYSESEAITDAESTSFSESQALSTADATSRSKLSGVGDTTMSSDMLTPWQGPFGTPMLVGMSQGVASSAHSASGTGSCSARGNSSGSSMGSASMHAVTQASAWGESRSQGTSRATSIGRAETRGTGRPAEPPKHSNRFSPTGLPLCTGRRMSSTWRLRRCGIFQTGQAFVNFVGKIGKTCGGSSAGAAVADELWQVRDRLVVRHLEPRTEIVPE